VLGAHEPQVLAQDLQQGVVDGRQHVALLPVDVQPQADLHFTGRSGFVYGVLESLAPEWIRPLAADETLRLRSWI
jgi:hypothetical protein